MTISGREQICLRLAPAARCDLLRKDIKAQRAAGAKRKRQYLLYANSAASTLSCG
jgi:hypothetical protein